MAETGSTSQTLDSEWSRDLVSLRTPARQLVQTSYEKSALTLEEYADLVISFAESSPERARRAAVQKRLNICRDAWGPLIKSALKNWTTSPVLKAVLGENEDHIDLSRNPAKIIWQELSVTYKSPPRRSTPKKPDDINLYNALLEGTGFDTWWPIVEFLLHACNEILIWPDVITVGGKQVIKHRYALGNTASIITTDADPTVIECVCIIDQYRDLSSVDHTVYRLWTDKWHAQFERNEDNKLQRTGYINPALVPEDGDPAKDNSAANPYGEIPMHLVRLTPWADSIWDQTSGEDLVDLNVKGGEERQFYRYHGKMSGFKQAAVTGQSIEKKPQQLLDPGSCLEFETDGSLTIIDWQLDQKSRLDCMLADELAAAASYGINPERYKRTGNYQTAGGAQNAERGLEERRIRNAPIFKEAEAAYKRMLCIVAQKHGLDNVPDPDVRLEVEHAPLAYPGDPKSQIEVEKAELSMGFESYVTLVKRRHPDWTDSECEKFIKDNMDLTSQINEIKVKRNIPDDPTNQTRSAESWGATGPQVRDSAGGPPPPNQQAIGK